MRQNNYERSIPRRPRAQSHDSYSNAQNMPYRGENKIRHVANELRRNDRNPEDYLKDATGMLKRYTLQPGTRAVSIDRNSRSSDESFRKYNNSPSTASYRTSTSLDYGSTHSRSETDNSISERIKEQALRRDFFKCWTCETRRHLKFAHVVSSEPTSFKSHIDSGVLPFSSSESIDNVITLCHVCRSEFLNPDLPGWIFVPTDLQYFIRFEKDDYQLRVEAASRGVAQDRVIPDVKSCSYTRYVLSSQSTRVNEMRTHRHWDGSPTAAILHAARAVLNLKPFKRTKLFDLQEDLRELLGLYTRPAPKVEDPTSDLKSLPCGADCDYIERQEMRARAKKYLQDIRRRGKGGRRIERGLREMGLNEDNLLVDVDGEMYRDIDSDAEDDGRYKWGPDNSSYDKMKYIKKTGRRLSSK